ncbi:thiamine pyrophosphate-requiring protein [Limobrevibacterium gyesilva]|uniref:Thiamine pyrophosphate-requiring protein n=1 Tax=Limobrevibacterium gyesilva TaxID=2991712 RepID=A0AA41YQ67_9PROT|nr:thiamine pyrophosphate-requiring protein [Limobrevibacterium gyesilva]
MYTASTAFLEALGEAGVSYIFANLGSDHPGLVEAMAEARATGRSVPALITCPNEMVALSAAHGFAQTGGRAQCVLVHVECGTQALAGAVHNAAKGRIPALIFAGSSPFTQEGELRGSRNEFIQWIQDVFDQRGLVRGYMRYDNELRTGRNVKQMIHRALQFAYSEPRGPVYLMAAREVLEEEVPRVETDLSAWQPIAPAALAPEGVEDLVAALLGARRPLVVTSYLGRKAEAVEQLVRLCRRLGVAVLESVPNYMNFPADDPLYQGCQWNEPVQNQALAEADMVLVLDSDVPWISAVSRPRSDAAIFHIDTDPLKQQMPLWYIAARRVFRADVATALRQVNARLDQATIDAPAVAARMAHYRRRHADRIEALRSREQPNGAAITPEYLTACIRARVDANTIVLNEGISNYKTIIDHLMSTRPGSMFTSGGGSLGWNGGAAIGAKLAHPEATVMALGGDGSYMFSVPSTVHWMARQYKTPFLQVVYNNRGWKSPKLSALAVHPDSYASRANDIGVSFDPPPDYAGIAAAAGGALALTLHRPEVVEPALDAALKAVREEGRAAVLDVWLPHL